MEAWNRVIASWEWERSDQNDDYGDDEGCSFFSRVFC
jgi:hypothetical protein